mgnify:FL=1
MRIVALHGQLGMASDWDGLAGKMAGADHEVSAVDLWSYLADGEVGMEEFGRKLNQDERDGQVLLGYSMGGRLALHALLDEPEKWKAAVIVSAHAGLTPEHKEQRRVVDDEWASKAEHLPWTKFLGLWNKQGVLGNEVMPDRASLEKRRAEISRSFNCWSLAEQEILLEKIAVAIEIPVLFVMGKNDKKFLSLWDMLGSGMDNATVLSVSDAGHRVPWEAEDDFIDGMLSWLRGLETE